MEMFAITSVHKLIERNIHTELLCYPDSKIHSEARAQGLVTHPVKASGYFHPQEAWKISRLIKENNFDLVHTQASKDLWVLSPALWLTSRKIPLIMTKQVGSFIVKKDLLHKAVYSRLTYALAISEVIKKNLVDTCPLTDDKVLLLHNSVDTKRFDPKLAEREKVRNEFNIKENDIVIGMLARFSWGKGHEEFLHAARKLSMEHSNLKFMIVGEPSRGEDGYGQKIINLVEEYKLKEKVLFTGFRKDTPDVLSAMDIFAFPSHSEAFGIALVEAMAMGKPTVVSNSDGVLDIARDGETSYLFQKQDGDDLAAKLNLLIRDENLREQFGNAGRERAVKHFDIKILTDRVIDIYNQALKRTKA